MPSQNLVMKSIATRGTVTTAVNLWQYENIRYAVNEIKSWWLFISSDHENARAIFYTFRDISSILLEGVQSFVFRNPSQNRCLKSVIKPYIANSVSFRHFLLFPFNEKFHREHNHLTTVQQTIFRNAHDILDLYRDKELHKFGLCWILAGFSIQRRSAALRSTQDDSVAQYNQDESLLKVSVKFKTNETTNYFLKKNTPTTGTYFCYLS